MKNLIPFFTRENITLALAILGSIGTLTSWTHTLLGNRKNLNVRVVGQRFSEMNNDSLLLYMSFENKSRLPIAITSIGIKINEITYTCTEIPIVTFQETTRCKGEILSHHEYTSIPLPISLSGLGATSGYVYFEFPGADFEFDATHLNFQLTTNRGRSIEKTLSLGRHLD